MSETTTTTIDEVHAGSATDWSVFDAMTEEQRTAAANSDPACPPASDARLKRSRIVANPRFTRRRFGLDLEDFAIRFGIPLARLKYWELGGYHSDPIARTLLQVIDREPEAVTRAIARMPAELYDCYGAGGFIVPGHAELRPVDSKKPLQRAGIGKVGIEFSGVRGERLIVTNYHNAGLVAPPRFRFPSLPREYIPSVTHGQLEFRFELSGENIGAVEHEIGREKYESGASASDQEIGIVSGHCKVTQTGMRLKLAGIVREARENQQSELHFDIDAIIEWRILRFLMPMLWVQIMHGLVNDGSR